MAVRVRVLGITNLYPPYAGGGYGEICADTMAGLAARGHDVTMLVARGESARGVEVRAELDYVLAPWRRPVRGLRAVAHDERLVRNALARGVDAGVVWHMRGLVKPPLTLLHQAGVPVVYVLHDRWILYERAGGPKLIPWPKLDPYARRARRLATRVARLELRAPPIVERGIVRFASRWLRDEYARAGWVARDEGTLASGVDVEAIRKRRKTPPRTPPERLLYAGRIDPSKGLHVAVRAVAQTSGRLTIAGPPDDAAYEEDVRRVARELDASDRLEWRGELSREQVLDELASHDVLIYPSIGDEAYSIGLLEAFAAGIVVITSAPGGPREYLEHEVNALVFEPGDAAALAGHLQRLEQDGALTRQLLAGARETANRFSIDNVVDQLEAELERAKRKRPHA
jgi:glycosyltransferase involved in cell wall biosynthesis